MKKILLALTLSAFVFMVRPVAADEAVVLGKNLNPGGIKNEIRDEVREVVREKVRQATEPAKRLQEEVRNRENVRQNIVDQIKDKIKSMIPARLHGILTTIAGTRLIVTTGKGDYTVNVVPDTILKRRFGADSALSEFAVGDELAVVAKRGSSSSATAENTVEARYIRDLSIQRRNTVFSGEVTSVNTGDNSLTVKTLQRGDQTVYAKGDTLIIDKDKRISFTDLKTGDRIIVKGELWDRALTKIDAKRIIRLPSRITAAPTPSVTP